MQLDPHKTPQRVAFDQSNSWRLADLLRLQSRAHIAGGLAEIGTGEWSLKAAAQLPSNENQLYLRVHRSESRLKLAPASVIPIGDDSHQLRVGTLPIGLDELRPALGSARLRLVSIEASEHASDIVHNLDLTSRLVVSGGIVLLHRVPDSDWPSMMEGISRYFLLHPVKRLFPFMMGDKILWLTTYDQHAKFLHYAQKVTPVGPAQQKRVTGFFGSEMVGF
jgi:hypothetical protein